MTDTRQITGGLQGALLTQLLNRKVAKGDRRLRQLQRDLERLFEGISTLRRELPRINPSGDWPSNVRKVTAQLNAFLETCKEYPQVFIARPSRMAPFLQAEQVPIRCDPTRQSAIAAICALVRYKLLDRIRQCQRATDGNSCGIWFFAKKSDGNYHSRECQMKTSEERKQQKREYARRRYWREKELEPRKNKKSKRRFSTSGPPYWAGLEMT